MFILDSFQFIWGGISGSSNEIPCGLPIWRYGLWNTQDGWRRLRFVYLFCVSPVQNISNYYMAESACGKIKRILCFNWLPEWAIWDFADSPRWSCKKILFHVTNSLRTKFLWSKRLGVSLDFFSPRFIKAQRRTWPIFSFFDLTLGQ